jgi:hypothetical protein
MRFNSRVEIRRLSEWHDHFAWTPIRVSDDDVRWLETIERKLISQTPLMDGRLIRDWRYRAK